MEEKRTQYQNKSIHNVSSAAEKSTAPKNIFLKTHLCRHPRSLPCLLILAVWFLQGKRKTKGKRWFEHAEMAARCAWKTLANCYLLSQYWSPSYQRLLLRSGFIPAEVTQGWKQGRTVGGVEADSRAHCRTKALFHVRIAVASNPLNELRPALTQTLADGAEWKAVPWHQHRSPSETLKIKKRKKEKAQPDRGQGWQDNTTEERIIEGYCSWRDTVWRCVIIQYAV